MSINSAFNLTQTCDVYRKVTLTNSDLGYSIRGEYSDTPTYHGVNCFRGPSITNARGGAISRNMYGDNYTEADLIVFSDASDIQEQDKVVIKTDRGGTALSAAEQARNTFIIERIMDGSRMAGVLQCVGIPARVNN